MDWINIPQLLTNLLGLQCEGATLEICKIAGSLAGSVITLAGTALVALLSFLGTKAWAAWSAGRETTRKRIRCIVDLAVYADFVNNDIQEKFSRAVLPQLEALIDNEPKTMRFYVVATGSTDALTAIQAVRHTFDPAGIKAIDRFVDHAIHFRSYYEATGSDAFAALSKPRKKAVAANLISAAEQLKAAIDDMRHKVPEVAKNMQETAAKQTAAKPAAVKP